jgi:hypothetical protein
MFKNACCLQKNSQMFAKRKMNANDFEPRRIALCFSPPMLIIEYIKPSVGKLYHKRFKMKSKFSRNSVDDVITNLKNRYRFYFMTKKISDEQLSGMLVKLADYGKWPQKKNNLFKNEAFTQADQNCYVTHSTRSQIADSNENIKNFQNHFPTSQSQILNNKIGLKRTPLVKEATSEEFSNILKQARHFNVEIGEGLITNETNIQKSQRSSKEGYIKTLNIKNFESDFDRSLIDDSEYADQNGEDDFDEIDLDEEQQISRSVKSTSKFDLMKNLSDELSELKGINISGDDLNIVNNGEITKIKRKMESQFAQNEIGKENPEFKCHKQADFEPDLSNEWDGSEFGSYQDL